MRNGRQRGSHAACMATGREYGRVFGRQQAAHDGQRGRRRPGATTERSAAAAGSGNAARLCPLNHASILLSDAPAIEIGR